MDKYAFEFAGQNLVSLVSGCLYWPDEKMMIVSDLHLEKGSDFVKVGRFVPPYDSCETLTRLMSDLDNNEVETLILLGDTVHDPQGFARLDKNCIDMFEEICKRHRVIWIIGNHEKGFVPQGVEAHIEYPYKSLMFRHEATETAQLGEVSGHYHPCITVKHKGKSLRRRCFIEDGKRLILPAFGSYTGSLDVEDSAISKFFPNGYNAHALGQKIMRIVENEKVA